MKTRKCREEFPLNRFIHRFLHHAGATHSKPVLGIIATILTLLPAMIYGCTEPDPVSGKDMTETTVRIMQAANVVLDKAESIDVLIFNDDRMQKLDTYQRFPMTSCSTIKASSTAGEKIMSVLINSRRDRYEWVEIFSHESLKGICGQLEKETEEFPLMSGECRIQAGNPANIKVERLMSEIVLKTLSCDFKDKSYEGKPLADVRIYLTNVSAETPLITDTRHTPSRIVNHGKLVMDDVESFTEPESILQELSYDIGAAIKNVDIKLRCYPNEVPEETSGTPFTRLVIEGTVDGNVYYWPININRADGQKGIARNCRYVFDVKLRRLGHTDPDIPVEIEDAQITMEVEPWEDMEEYGVRF